MIAHETTGDGPDVILLHGVGLDASMWDRCLPTLSESCRVTTVDLPGHGGSPPAAERVTLADLAVDVVEVLDEVGAESVHVVGFSLGALVAQQLALTHPGRMASLALVSSVADRSPAERDAVLARLGTASSDHAATVDAAVDRWFSPPWRAQDPDLVEAIRKTMLAVDHTSYLACYRVFATADEQLWPQLPRIACPTLVVTGAEDTGSTPDMTHRLAGAMPGAVALVVPGARHLLPLEEPAALTHAVLHLIERSRR